MQSYTKTYSGAPQIRRQTKFDSIGNLSVLVIRIRAHLATGCAYHVFWSTIEYIVAESFCSELLAQRGPRQAPFERPVGELAARQSSQAEGARGRNPMVGRYAPHGFQKFP